MGQIVNSDKSPIMITHKQEPDLWFGNTWTGAAEYCIKKAKERNESIPSPKFADGNKIVEFALKWLGKPFCEGETAQCMNFVRQVLKEAGYNPGVTSKPSDGITEPMGTGYANSLAGNDIGLLIKEIDQLQCGDIVFFRNTYGDWPEGTITHVGIYLGNGFFIHRPTYSKPVQKTSFISYGHFKEGRRLYI